MRKSRGVGERGRGKGDRRVERRGEMEKGRGGREGWSEKRRW